MSKPYRPSNGTEGEWFMEDFCYRCKNDSEDNPCPIIGRTMGYDIDDIGYPTEWICDDDGLSNPRCTAFEAKSDARDADAQSQAAPEWERAWHTTQLCKAPGCMTPATWEILIEVVPGIMFRVYGCDRHAGKENEQNESST